MKVTQTLESLSILTDNDTLFRELRDMISRNFTKILSNKNKVISFYEESEIPQRKCFLKFIKKLYEKQSDDKLATTIKELMFTFEDIINLNATAIREILKNVDKKDLMVAFKGSSDGIKDKFLSNMSQRAAEAFKEEMQYLGAVRVKDVEEAQRRIVETVQTLADQGVFQVGEADEMIE